MSSAALKNRIADSSWGRGLMMSPLPEVVKVHKLNVQKYLHKKYYKYKYPFKIFIPLKVLSTCYKFYL